MVLNDTCENVMSLIVNYTISLLNHSKEIAPNLNRWHNLIQEYCFPDRSFFIMRKGSKSRDHSNKEKELKRKRKKLSKKRTSRKISMIT